MSRAVVGRWGKNLAIRFPAEIAEAARLSEGERVEIAASGDEVVIRKLPAETLPSRPCSPAAAGSLAGALPRRLRLGCGSRSRAHRGMNEAEYWPDAGDLIWTDFDPTLGREQAGRRPALVVSPTAFALNTGFVLVCPITSRVRPFPTSVVLPDRPADRGRDPPQPSAQPRRARPADPPGRRGRPGGNGGGGARQARGADRNLRRCRNRLFGLSQAAGQAKATKKIGPASAEEDAGPIKTL